MSPMTMAARARRLLATLPLLLAAMPAFAVAPQCGEFVEEDIGIRVEILSPNQGVRHVPSSAADPLWLQSSGNTLQVAHLDLGMTSTWQVEDGGRALREDTTVYRLKTPKQCRAAAPVAPGSCLAAPAACLDSLYNAPAAELQRWCAEGVPAACSRLVDTWHSEAREADSRPLNEDPDLQEPELCKEASPAYDEAACAAAAKAAMGKAMGLALMGALDTRAVALPAAQRSTLQQLCLAHSGGSFCRSVAEQQWSAADYAAAIAALQAGCRAGDERACQAHGPLGTLTSPLTLQPAQALPCGTYASEGGLMDTLVFADGGRVDVGMGTTLRARLEDGRIRIRHDRGGDFVLAPLASGELLGTDEWTRFQVFRRQGAAGTCSAGVSFKEVPLPRDCPAVATPGGAGACCQAGKLQGCNALGHQLALADNWAQAATNYLQVCRAGIREGCENLASAQEHDSAVDARGLLQQACDAQGPTHVACDVVATRNWEMMAFGAALRQSLEAVGNEQDEAPAASSKAAARNRKGL
mgnify:CR=1 FL=1